MTENDYPWNEEAVALFYRLCWHLIPELANKEDAASAAASYAHDMIGEGGWSVFLQSMIDGVARHAKSEAIPVWDHWQKALDAVYPTMFHRLPDGVNDLELAALHHRFLERHGLPTNP